MPTLNSLMPTSAARASIDAEILERLQHVEVRLARRHEPEPRIAAVDDRAIERVRARERERGRQLVALQPELLVVRRIRPADVQAAGRQRELRRHDRRALAATARSSASRRPSPA